MKYYILTHPLLRVNNINQDMTEPTITLNVTKFKEILLHSWELIPPDKQHELILMGIYPRK